MSAVLTYQNCAVWESTAAMHILYVLLKCYFLDRSEAKAYGWQKPLFFLPSA